MFGAIHGECDEVLLLAWSVVWPAGVLYVPDDLLHGELKVAEAMAGTKSKLVEYYAEPHSSVQPYNITVMGIFSTSNP